MMSSPFSTFHGLIKICGLREPEHAAAAVESGADLIGFLFAPSKRRVDAATARVCIEAMRAATGGQTVLSVGVFVDAPWVEIQRTVEQADLDVVQIHESGAAGSKNVTASADSENLSGRAPATLGGTRRSVQVIQAIRIEPGVQASQVLQMVARAGATAPPPSAWLIDGFDPLLHGGTGKRADWPLAAKIAAVAPVVLAGGLNAMNVGEAIETVRPLGVDVSGGVETDGRKDSQMIAEFVRSARESFASLGR